MLKVRDISAEAIVARLDELKKALVNGGLEPDHLTAMAMVYLGTSAAVNVGFFKNSITKIVDEVYEQADPVQSRPDIISSVTVPEDAPVDPRIELALLQDAEALIEEGE
jgi:hypothetical protein